MKHPITPVSAVAKGRAVLPLLSYTLTALAVLTTIGAPASNLLAQTGKTDNAAELVEEEIRLDAETVAVVFSPWRKVAVGTSASLRGLHVVDESVVWASGTGGTIINTIDGGDSWRVHTVTGAEELDFRDIHAIDDGTAIAMTSGTPARIYRTTDGGSRWKLCYENKDPKVFLDAITFLDDQRGVVMGDPIGDGLFLLKTDDGGKTWSNFSKVPRVEPGEGGFAASGTNMNLVGKRRIAIGLGSGLKDRPVATSRVLLSDDAGETWTSSAVPIPRGESAGIFSLCFADEKNGVAVGGDYKQADRAVDNYAVTRDGGQTWSAPTPRQPPTGFRSCAAVWKKNGRELTIVAVGTNGTDVSSDLGNKWHRVSNNGFHAVQFSPDGLHGWATGADGRVAKWIGIRPRKPANPSEAVVK